MSDTVMDPMDALETERRKLHIVRDGVTARYSGIPISNNPHTDMMDNILWETGWNEADEELTLLNLAAVAVDVLEGMVRQEEGVYKIDDALVSVFRKAVEDARTYVD